MTQFVRKRGELLSIRRPQRAPTRAGTGTSSRDVRSSLSPAGGNDSAQTGPGAGLRRKQASKLPTRSGQ